MKSRSTLREWIAPRAARRLIDTVSRFNGEESTRLIHQPGMFSRRYRRVAN